MIARRTVGLRTPNGAADFAEVFRRDVRFCV